MHDSDTSELNGRIIALQGELNGQVAALRGETIGQLAALNGRIDSLNEKIDTSIKELKGDLTLTISDRYTSMVNWIVGSAFFNLTIAAAIQYYATRGR